MLGSKDVERMICELLDMGDEQLIAEMEKSLFVSDERHQRIHETLEEMVRDVDVLLLRMDAMEKESLNDEEKESNAR